MSRRMRKGLLADCGVLVVLVVANDSIHAAEAGQRPVEVFRNDRGRGRQRASRRHSGAHGQRRCRL